MKIFCLHNLLARSLKLFCFLGHSSAVFLESLFISQLHQIHFDVIFSCPFSTYAPDSKVNVKTCLFLNYWNIFHTEFLKEVWLILFAFRENIKRAFHGMKNHCVREGDGFAFRQPFCLLICQSLDIEEL